MSTLSIVNGPEPASDAGVVAPRTFVDVRDKRTNAVTIWVDGAAIILAGAATGAGLADQWGWSVTLAASSMVAASSAFGLRRLLPRRFERAVREHLGATCALLDDWRGGNQWRHVPPEQRERIERFLQKAHPGLLSHRVKAPRFAAAILGAAGIAVGASVWVERHTVSGDGVAYCSLLGRVVTAPIPAPGFPSPPTTPPPSVPPIEGDDKTPHAPPSAPAPTTPPQDAPPGSENRPAGPRRGRLDEGATDRIVQLLELERSAHRLAGLSTSARDDFALEKVRTLVTNVVDPDQSTRESLDQMKDQLQEWYEAANDLSGRVGDLGDISDKVGAVAGDLRKAVDQYNRLGQAAEKFLSEPSLQTFEQMLNELNDFLQSLADLLSALQDLQSALDSLLDQLFGDQNLGGGAGGQGGSQGGGQPGGQESGQPGGQGGGQPSGQNGGQTGGQGQGQPGGAASPATNERVNAFRNGRRGRDGTVDKSTRNAIAHDVRQGIPVDNVPPGAPASRVPPPDTTPDPNTIGSGKGKGKVGDDPSTDAPGGVDAGPASESATGRVGAPPLVRPSE